MNVTCAISALNGPALVSVKCECVLYIYSSISSYEYYINLLLMTFIVERTYDVHFKSQTNNCILKTPHSRSYTIKQVHVHTISTVPPYC